MDYDTLSDIDRVREEYADLLIIGLDTHVREYRGVEYRLMTLNKGLVTILAEDAKLLLGFKELLGDHLRD